MAEVLKQVRAVIDGRTSMVCLDVAGQTRRVGEPFDTLLGPQQAPPFHIWCRSIVVPWVRGMDTQEAEAEREARTRPPSARRNLPPKAASETPKPKAPDRPGGNRRVWTSESKRPLRPGWARPYTSSEDVNEWLRSGRPLEEAPKRVRDAVADLDAAIAQAAPLTEPMRGYRVVTDPARVAGRNNAVGLVFRDPAFGSVTSNAIVAGLVVAALSENDVEGVVVIVTAPTGSRVVVLDEVPADAEVVLPRGAAYRVDSDRMERFDGRRVRVWRVTVVDEGNG